MAREPAAIRIHRGNRRIKRAKKAFLRMSPAQKVVRIAKDVLEQIEAKWICPTRGTWVSRSGDIREPIYFGKSGRLIGADKQLRDLLPRLEACNACAVGSLFLCTVARADALTIGDLSRGTSTPFVSFHGLSRPVRDYMLRYFSVSQLRLIEIAFEGGGGAHGSTDDHERAAAAMFTKNESSKKRLTVLMKNVIKNEGKFVVPKSIYVREGLA